MVLLYCYHRPLQFGEPQSFFKTSEWKLAGFFFGTLYRWMEKVTCQIPEEGMVPAQPGAKRTKISPILFSTNLAVMLTHYMTWILSWPSFIFFSTQRMDVMHSPYTKFIYILFWKCFQAYDVCETSSNQYPYFSSVN